MSQAILLLSYANVPRGTKRKNQFWKNYSITVVQP